MLEKIDSSPQLARERPIWLTFFAELYGFIFSSPSRFLLLSPYMRLVGPKTQFTGYCLFHILYFWL